MKENLVDLFAMSVNCPAESKNKNCCFNEIRKLSLKKRYEALNKMNTDEKQKLMISHVKCPFNR